MPEEKYGSEAACPYCDYEMGDTWELFLRHSSETTTRTCWNCDREFEVERQISVEYISRPLPEKVSA